MTPEIVITVGIPGCSIEYPKERLQWVGKPKGGE